MFDGRIEWLEDDYEVDIPLDKKNADVLLTVSSIELMKYPKSIVAMARLLNQAGVNWTFSSKGYEATNFGFLAGKSDISKLAITRIVEAAEELGTKILVIPECGHAYGIPALVRGQYHGPSAALPGDAYHGSSGPVKT